MNKKILLLVVLLVIGFASVSTILILNGTAKISANTSEFDVYFSNAIENGKIRKSLIKDETHISFLKDMTLVGEKYELDYDVTNGSRNYDAELTINCTKSNEYLNIINEFDTSANLLATETRSGKLTVEVLKAYAGTEENSTKDIELTCTIVANAVEREELATGSVTTKSEIAWNLTSDNDNDGTLSFGDEIGIDDEYFYVYKIEGESVLALAKYNLLQTGTINYLSPQGYPPETVPITDGHGFQDPTAKGYIQGYKVFSVSVTGFGMIDKTKEFSYENSYIQKYNEGYREKLLELSPHVIDVRGITKDEMIELGCDLNSRSCKNAPLFVYSTSYWSSTPADNASEDFQGACGVETDGEFGCSESYVLRGIRPVVELPKSLFN